jgi:hypothetical protein
MSSSFEAGDNLFEIIFEIDRKLQHVQQPLIPLSKLREALKEIEQIIQRLEDKQPDTSNSIFLKLIDCFIRCSSNAKRQNISSFLQEHSSALRHLPAPQPEAFKRLKSFWDSCFASDFEACRQVLLFLNVTIDLFFLHRPLYALLFEALNEDLSGPIGAFVYRAEAGKLFESCTLLLIAQMNQTKADQDSLESLLQLYKFSQQVTP